MRAISIARTAVSECERCRGLWLDVPSFEGICANPKEQAALLGVASRAPVSAGDKLKVQYGPCPDCDQIMNRINFDRSGVVVDICKGHGIWFDHKELWRIVEFIRAGNLGKARNRHQTELEQERIRTHRAMTKRIELGASSADYDYPWYQNGVEIASAADVLSLLRD
jgi:Zn-finger nucleic acid-binding protein